MKKKGFTLIELIIVVVLLSILLGLVLPRLPFLTEQAITNVDQGNLFLVQKQVDNYYYSKDIAAQTRAYPFNPLEYSICTNTEYFPNGCPAHTGLNVLWCIDAMSGLVSEVAVSTCP